ncbi:hypothetical protein [Corynebacterium sp. Marseille-Q2516]
MMVCRRIVLGLLAVGCAVAVGGCTIDRPGSAPADSSHPSAVPAPTVPAPHPSAAPVSSLDEVVAGLPGTAGVAVFSPGQELAAGFQDPAPGWSTMKVPVAIAALRGLAPARHRDNRAAALWSALGTPEQAGRATTRASAPGNQRQPAPSAPRFPPSARRSGRWHSRRVLPVLPQLDGSGPVTAAMGAIVPEQSWGLGRLPEARFKGGWGPDESGAYLVRQLGYIDRGAQCAPVGIAVLAKAEDGTFESATAMLSTMAERLDQLRAGSLHLFECPRP